MFEPIRKKKQMNYKEYAQYKKTKKKAKKYVYNQKLRTA